MIPSENLSSKNIVKLFSLKTMTFWGLLVSCVFYVLCFPKWNLGFLAWVAFVPCLLIIPQYSFKKSFFTALLIGFLANLGTLYWVYPVCRWGGVNVFVSGLALLALSVYMALYWGAFGVVVRYGECLSEAWRPFFYAAGWVVLEFVRAHVFTGFPWLLFGYAQWPYPWVLSLSEIGGPYIISFLLMLFNGMVFVLVKNMSKGSGQVRQKILPSGLFFVVLLLLNFFLYVRPLKSTGPAVSVAIIQGNIDQYKKWDASYEEDIVKAYSELTLKAGQEKVDLIVWPETAVPGWVPNDRRYMDWLSALSKEAGSFLLVGAVSRQERKDYNAAFLFSPAGDLSGQHLKQHLVPFGEYVPFQWFFGRFTDVLNALGTFDSSDQSTVLKTGKTYLGVNICFEDLFPSLVSDFVKQGAEMNVNITNDGWYKKTAAAEQHFIANVFRAVETRTWMIRAANTGVSGFIDPHGQVAARSSLMTPGVIYGKPQPMSGMTFYTRFGDVFGWACLLFVFLFLLKKFDRILNFKF